MEEGQGLQQHEGSGQHSGDESVRRASRGSTEPIRQLTLPAPTAWADGQSGDMVPTLPQWDVTPIGLPWAALLGAQTSEDPWTQF